MISDRPVVFVSPSCNHCRRLLQSIEQSGAGDSYKFVNVDKEKRLPRFVDRVPLMFDGHKVLSDESLFQMFESAAPAPTSFMAEPKVAPSAGISGVFSSSYAALGADAECLDDQIDAGNLWLVDGKHDGIETPDCKPMPTE